MTFGSSRGIKTGKWYPNELLKDGDMSFIGLSGYQNLTDVLATLASQQSVDEVLKGLELTHSTLLTCNLAAGAAVSFSGYYVSALDAWGFVADPGSAFSIVIPDTEPLAFSAGDVSNPRIDIVEVRPIQNPYNSRANSFKDPVTGLISTAVVNTRIEYVGEVRIVEGTPAASPSAPAGTAGWIKLAEVYVDTGATSISDSNIYTHKDSALWTQDPGTTLIDLDRVGELVNTLSTTVMETLGASPTHISGGFVYQGTGDTLNITSAVATFIRTLDSVPITFTLSTQTDMAISGATLDGVTVNYVKLSMDRYDSVKVEVGSVVPISGELELARFTGSTGGTFSIINTALEEKYSIVPSTDVLAEGDLIGKGPASDDYGVPVFTHRVNDSSIYTGYTVSGARVGGAYINDTHFAVAFYSLAATDSYYNKLVVGGWNGSGITWSNELTLDSTLVNGGLVGICGLSNNRGVIVYSAGDYTRYVVARIFEYNPTTNTLSFLSGVTTLLAVSVGTAAKCFLDPCYDPYNSTPDTFYVSIYGAGLSLRGAQAHYSAGSIVIDAASQTVLTSYGGAYVIVSKPFAVAENTYMLSVRIGTFDDAVTMVISSNAGTLSVDTRVPLGLELIPEASEFVWDSSTPVHVFVRAVAMASIGKYQFVQTAVLSTTPISLDPPFELVYVKKIQYVPDENGIHDITPWVLVQSQHSIDFNWPEFIVQPFNTDYYLVSACWPDTSPQTARVLKQGVGGNTRSVSNSVSITSEEPTVFSMFGPDYITGNGVSVGDVCTVHKTNDGNHDIRINILHFRRVIGVVRELLAVDGSVRWYAIDSDGDVLRSPVAEFEPFSKIKYNYSTEEYESDDSDVGEIIGIAKARNRGVLRLE